jgi:hypothetical protein
MPKTHSSQGTSKKIVGGSTTKRKQVGKVDDTPESSPERDYTSASRRSSMSKPPNKTKPAAKKAPRSATPKKVY